MSRLRLAAAALLALLGGGCIEGELVYTLNPDGSGKVEINALLQPMPEIPFFRAIKGPPDDPVEAIRQRTLGFLLESKGATAWRVERAEVAPDGRIRFVGTAYFRDLDQLQLFYLATPVYVRRDADGAMRLAQSSTSPLKDRPQQQFAAPVGADGKPIGKKDPPDVLKMTDRELDRWILEQRVQLQESRPFLLALLAELKVKQTFVLPGDPTIVRGFHRDGRRVWMSVNGADYVQPLNDSLKYDLATARRMARGAAQLEAMRKTPAWPLVQGVLGIDLEVVVPRPGKPQFDYAAEVTEANRGQAELRKRLRLDKEIKLPGDRSANVAPSMHALYKGAGTSRRANVRSAIT